MTFTLSRKRLAKDQKESFLIEGNKLRRALHLMT